MTLLQDTHPVYTTYFHRICHSFLQFLTPLGYRYSHLQHVGNWTLLQIQSSIPSHHWCMPWCTSSHHLLSWQSTALFLLVSWSPKSYDFSNHLAPKYSCRWLCLISSALLLPLPLPLVWYQIQVEDLLLKILKKKGKPLFTSFL